MAPSYITQLVSLESLLNKDARTDTFWLVIIFIFINAIWVAQQVTAFYQAEEQLKATTTTTAQDEDESTVLVEKAAPEEVAAAAAASSPSLDAAAATSETKPEAKAPESTWHSRNITSRSRRTVAVLISTSVIPLELLATWWMLRITSANTSAAVAATLPWSKPYLLSFLVRSPVYALLFAAWLFTFGFAAFALIMQTCFAVQLAGMDLPPREGTVAGESSETKKTQ